MHPDSREDFRLRERPERTSQMIYDLLQTLEGERVSLEDLVAALGDRGLGVLIALFAVPNILPATVPFGNVATGVPVIILALHLMLGWPRLVLPEFLAKRTIGTSLLKSLAPRIAKLLSRIERFLKPRLLGVSTPVAERLIGVLCLVLSIISAMPIPFLHMLPALGLCIIGLGLIEHDGLAIVSGIVLGLVGALAIGLILVGVASGLAHFPFIRGT